LAHGEGDFERQGVTEHLNLCRQFRQEFASLQAALGGRTPKDERSRDLFERLRKSSDLMRDAVKFALPVGGRTLDDRQYKAMDENEPLRLPFPMVALEYIPRGAFQEWQTMVERSIVICRETELGILVNPNVRIAGEGIKGRWVAMPEFCLPATGYLDRSKITDGWVSIVIYQEDATVPLSDYADEAGTILDFLNALSCSNVGTERIDPKPGAKVKGALPFDSYHILTIKPSASGSREGASGSHRSPREHLRRGHIRRLETGAKVWVNATVVNAGIGGKVSKDYRMAT
jgi:hypothetical protein